MPNNIKFTKIKYENIFAEQFANLGENVNSTIEFKMTGNGGMAVVYAPNGTGKTSLANVLGSAEASRNIYFEAIVNEETIIPSSNRFHVIRDQSTRNIIPGNTSDYLIGDDIKREYELRQCIEDIFEESFNGFSKELKTQFKVTKMTDYYLSKFDNQDVADLIRNIIPNRNHRAEIDRINFVQLIRGLEKNNISDDLDQCKIKFVIDNLEWVRKVLDISEEIGHNHQIAEIEKDDDAVFILRKYSSSCTCIVCDAPNLDSEHKISQKTENRNQIYNDLSQEIKDILDQIINSELIKNNDPFFIHQKITSFMQNGELTALNSVKQDIQETTDIICKLIFNKFVDIFSETELNTYFDEYSAILDRQPILDSEELRLINEVVNENIGPELTIVRDEDNGRNFRLLLDGKAFLGDDIKRQEPLKLSTGERNFISLAFELLLARHSDKDYVVLDDPISSFDSVYKNKIAYCIIKFLENQKNIILTHNLELVSLLEFQNSGCFNFYMLNNTETNSGFVSVKSFERKLLINLHDLVKLFRNGFAEMPLEEVVIDKYQFLISMIPFLRGYAHIICTEDDIYTRLSSIMHGYEAGEVNITEIYKSLFGYDFGEDYIVTVNDVLEIDSELIQTVDETKLPLLAETLKQTLLYYYLRMSVENTLVEVFPNSRRENENAMLGQIIQRAFRSNATDEDRERKLDYRVFFTSRKTLLNEFNHYEGNMNIFQPAIDIEDSALLREVIAIQAKLESLKQDYT